MRSRSWGTPLLAAITVGAACAHRGEAAKHGIGVSVILPEPSAAVYERALTVLRDSGYVVAEADEERGVITTHPRRDGVQLHLSVNRVRDATRLRISPGGDDRRPGAASLIAWEAAQNLAFAIGRHGPHTTNPLDPRR